MRYGRRQLAMIAAVAALVLVGAGIGVYAYLTRDIGPKSPPVLNRPTDASRVRTLRPGAQPGFPLAHLDREKHSEEH
jgi:hypothetical protein